MGSLTRLIVLKSDETKRNVYYMNEIQDVRGYVSCQEESVFSPFAKIEVETSKVNNKYVHLRFCHTNKYWGRRPTDNWIIASSDQQVEDRSNPACTLFEPNFSNGVQNVTFTHIQSGGRVRVKDAASGSMNSRLYLDAKNYGSYSNFSFIDWDTLVKLPKYITFKGDNGKFLQSVWYGPHGVDPCLQFAGDDFNTQYVAHELFLHPDGHVRIKSVYFDKFWRRSSDWIAGDSSDGNENDLETLFWPVKLDDNTIALRSRGNNLFCKRLTDKGKTNCLTAAVNNITSEARLTVQELVLERSIYNVRYRMEDARIYDETPFVAGIGTATNNDSTESTLAVKVAYTESTSRSFTNTISVMAGVKTTIVTGIPRIAEGHIEVSASASYAHEWGNTTTTTTTSEAIYTVKVPPKSRVIVNYVGTQGKCDVPFSYFQRDKRSSDGSFVNNEHIDGIFNGVNYYSYRFEQLPFEAI